MIVSIDAVELVLRVARGCVGACESPPNSNRGPFVERVLRDVGLGPGNPWCAAAAWSIGKTALGDKWPVVKTGGCAALGAWAMAKEILVNDPQPGDLFLLRELVAGEPVARFAHTGFVDVGAPIDGAHPTLEGNTSGGGSREGWLYAARRRAFKPGDRFVRWAQLLEVPAT